MCVVSIVMDHFGEGWGDKFWPVSPWVKPYQPKPWAPSIDPNFVPLIPKPINYPTQEEVDEFHRLLKRAREYDKEHHEPDCENDGKKALLKRMADALGVDISFVDEQ